MVQRVTIPVVHVPDSLVWVDTANGLLSLKDAYEVKRSHFPAISWAKSIWCKEVPPSRSLLVWRMMLDKLPTDDNLMFHSKEDIWKLSDQFLSPQCNIVVKSALINLFNAIWLARNNARFNNKIPNWRSSVSWIFANVNLAGTKEIIWLPPLPHWVKCNTDGASTSTSSSCGGIFRNSEADFMCAFADNLGVGSAFNAELIGALNAIELANSKHWSNLWLETDSVLVVKAFTNPGLIPWNLSNMWSPNR
ncbi:hypothetical protein TSUD_311230 [Trifolium subterraneum]|uniref:RNase H type-1 domain-containing protein n=1 Tax=Trifolium subterraneum TaxID=3900 RepID=A0A2Z6MZI2_TRISU|nr:hypothetical protein TSUD_311230 [Trifolium subterraneum]